MSTQNVGWLGVGDTVSQHGVLKFAIKMALGRVRTALPVKVMAVTAGGAADQWAVDIQPIVNQVDGAGNGVAHKTIKGIPVANLSGVNGSVSVKPAVGDLGFIVCADRDMSAAIKAKGAANPSSRRMHDLCDAVYYGGFGGLNTSANQVLITDSGITLNSAKTVTINAPNGATITGNVTVTGTITATGSITAGHGGADQVGLQTHKHSGVSTGGGSTLAPTAGT